MALSMTSVSFTSAGGSISKGQKPKTFHQLLVDCTLKMLLCFHVSVPVLCVMKTGVLEAGLSPRPATA